MRLGQLARKVNVKPAQIISFLAKEHNIIIEDNLNSKIENKDLAKVLEKFEEEIIELAKPIPAPEVLEIVEENDEQNTPELTVSEVDLPEVDVPNPIKEVILEQKEEMVIEPKTQSDNTILEVTEKLIAIDEDGEEIELRVVDGVIKAPKKELEGFKVIGKIDLPQKKKAITFIMSKGTESIDITDEIFEKREALAQLKKEQYLARKKKRKDKTGDRKGGKRKVLTELELKEKANRLAVEKQIKSSKVNKELKKKHYSEKVQPKSTTHKKKKKKSENQNGGIKKVKGFDKEPSTKLGKLWKWFNT